MAHSVMRSDHADAQRTLELLSEDDWLVMDTKEVSDFFKQLFSQLLEKIEEEKFLD